MPPGTPNPQPPAQRPANSHVGDEKTHESTQTSSRQTMTGRAYHGAHHQRRRNDLVLALGFLELANALDFAANVWNQTPPPTIAVVFMALGGTSAAILLILGMRDMPRSWRNYKLLRAERKMLQSNLQSLRASQMQDTPCQLTEHDLETHLNINYRELGNEIIDRFLMGLGLGFGAFTVAVGTYLAIAGANPSAFHASNILTGYLGNVPTVIYGLMNGAWCVYGWRRAQSHMKAIESSLPYDPWGADVDIIGDMRRRESQVKTHALINGFAGLLGAIGGLMTATAYIHPDAVWGYLVLIPSIVAAVFANVVWRWKINYDRDVAEPVGLDAHAILNDAGLAKSTAQAISEFRGESWKPKGWLCRNKASDQDRLSEALQHLLLRYARLKVQALAQREAYLNLAEEKESGASRASTLGQERLLISRQKEAWSDMVSLYTTTNTIKPLQSAVLVNSMFKVLSELDTVSDFLARLANNAKTKFLVEPAIKPQVLSGHLDQDAIMQNVRNHPDLEEEVLKIACETLLLEGLRAAKSQARYSLELVGAFLQDR